MTMTKIRKMRTVYNKQQQQLLNERFQETQYLQKQQTTQLACEYFLLVNIFCRCFFLTHFFSYSFFFFFTDFCFCNLAELGVYLFIYLFIYLLIYLFTYLFIYLVTYLLIYLFTYLLIYLFVYLFICLFK